MNILKGLILPLIYKSGAIIDGAGKIVIEANSEIGESTLYPAGRDALLRLAVELLNESFQYDKADIVLKKLGY